MSNPDFTMRLDISSTRADTHVTILSETGPAAAPVPTLSQRFAMQNGEWRWSLQTTDPLPLEVKIMTLGATLSSPPSNILSLYSAGTNPTATIKLDPGTGTAGTAKITIDGQPVLTQLAASGLYLTPNAASLLYLTETSADARYWRPTPSGGFSTTGSSAFGTSAVAMGAGRAYNAYSTALGSSEVFGYISTALGRSYAFAPYSTALGSSYK